MADAGQDMFSPYAAMGNEPAGQVDPNGTQFQPPAWSSFNSPLPFVHGLGPSRDNSPGGANEDAINFGAAGLFGLAAMARMDNAIPMDLLGAMADMSGELSFTANAAGNFQTGIGSPGGDGDKKGASGDGDPPKAGDGDRTSANDPGAVYLVSFNKIHIENGYGWSTSILDGLDVIFGHKGGTYDEYQWYQSLNVSMSLSLGAGGWKRDVAGGLFFYYSDQEENEKETALITDGNGYNTYFDDRPRFYNWGQNYNFNAQTTLLGRCYGDNSWNALNTIYWGYGFNNGIPYYLSPNINSGSSLYYYIDYNGSGGN